MVSNKELLLLLFPEICITFFVYFINETIPIDTRLLHITYILMFDIYFRLLQNFNRDVHLNTLSLCLGCRGLILSLLVYTVLINVVFR